MQPGQTNVQKFLIFRLRCLFALVAMSKLSQLFADFKCASQEISNRNQKAVKKMLHCEIQINVYEVQINVYKYK